MPGGQLEIVSIDPRLGGIFYIFDIPRGSAPVKVERSARCFNCHAEFEIGRGRGCCLRAWCRALAEGVWNRSETTARAMRFLWDRFGGWHLTGRHGIDQHQGNLVGEFVAGVIKTYPNPPAKNYRSETTPWPPAMCWRTAAGTSSGFVNRAIKATYDTRAAWPPARRRLSFRNMARHWRSICCLPGKPRCPPRTGG